MAVQTPSQKIESLKKSLASIDSQIKGLQGKNYSDEGPELCSLEIKRSRLAAELTEAEKLSPQSEAA